MEQIQICDLSKSFDLGQGVQPILSHLDVNIPLGAITVVLGRSGCGKSTLLRILGGELAADSGIVRMPEGFHSTMLYPEPYLISWTSVQHNVELACGVNYTPPEREQKAREILELVQLSRFSTLTPPQLSTGMRQRLGLARALASESQLLLMDEPFASLDFCTREELQQQLLQVQQELPRTIVFVTHQLEEAMLLAQQIVVLHADGSACCLNLQEEIWQNHDRLKERIMQEYRK